MEKNYIGWTGNTHFYIDLINKEYGVRINPKDKYRADEIIEYFKKEKKKQIEAWQKMWKEGVA